MTDHPERHDHSASFLDDTPAVTMTNRGATLRLYLHNVVDDDKPFKIVQIFSDEAGARAPTVEQQGTNQEEIRLALEFYVEGLQYEGWVRSPRRTQG